MKGERETERGIFLERERERVRERERDYGSLEELH